MHDKNYLLSLLDYGVWANEEFFKTIRELPADEVTKQRESLMNSILKSVNHLLVIDKVWMAHMRGEKHSFENLQTVLHEDLDDLWTAKKQTEQEIRDYVSGLSEDELEEVVTYELIGGNSGSLPRYMIITHLVMHGGFHRGFIGDMFGQVPVRPAGQDIPVWERALRQA
jgi:uncharacterized damage-inducible protein DinB